MIYPALKRAGFHAIILAAGMAGSLEMVFDVGHAASYPGSGQTYTNQAGAEHLNVGATSSSEASDPTFSGAAGSCANTTYWTFDGGDYFRLATTNPTYIQNMHKNNAIWSVAIPFFAPTTITTGLPFFGDAAGSTSKIGLSSSVLPTRQIRLDVNKGTAGSSTLLHDSTITTTANSNNFVGTSIDEAAGTGTTFINGTSESFTSTYTSPSASNATHTFEVHNLGNAAFAVESGTRSYGFMLWGGRKLSVAEYKVLFFVIRSRLRI